MCVLIVMERAKQSDPGAATKDARSVANTGYLLFENDEGESALIRADTFGESGRERSPSEIRAIAEKFFHDLCRGDRLI